MAQEESSLFHIRKTTEADHGAIALLLESEGMGVPAAYLDGYVAVNDDDEPVGYIRVQETEKGPHVAPVAVFSAWRGRGVGRALMEHELCRCGSLKLVAQGLSAPFYRALGYREIPFSQISCQLEEDCGACGHVNECGPVPFMKSYEG